MAATGYEIGMYEDIKRIRVALETIADVMKSFNTLAAYVVETGGVTGKDPDWKERQE